ncbi:cytochrome P450 [Xylariaceae sp. FL1272]|nr:cytochrome P450 [Xylariaceae sp. FL1272]
MADHTTSPMATGMGNKVTASHTRLIRIDLPSFPFAREHGVDPPSLNAKLRHEAPTSHVKLYDGKTAWILTKHKDCRAALSSDKLSADRRTPGYPEIHEGGHKAKEATPTFVNMDDPEHDKQRAMLEPEFSEKTVEEKWRPMMEQVIDAVLDDFVRKGKKEQPIDLIKHLATPVPTQIIYKALGVPDEDVERLSQDSEVRNSTSRNAAEISNENLQGYMKELVNKKKEHPGDDITSRLIRDQLERGKLNMNDIATLAFLLLTAGNAALINSIGLGTMTLLSHPDQLSDLKKDPEHLAGKVVNEITRYHTASALNSRRAVKEDVRIGDQVLKKGDGVICSVQAANRDDEMFKNPEEFNVHREMSTADTLGFGDGPHRCLADAFSRAQLEIFFTKVFQRLPKMRLARDPSDLPYTEPTMNIGVTELPVYFE